MEYYRSFDKYNILLRQISPPSDLKDCRFQFHRNSMSWGNMDLSAMSGRHNAIGGNERSTRLRHRQDGYLMPLVTNHNEYVATLMRTTDCFTTQIVECKPARLLAHLGVARGSVDYQVTLNL